MRLGKEPLTSLQKMRFIWGGNKNVNSKSILEVGVDQALRAVCWDIPTFQERGGVYDWTKEALPIATDCTSEPGCGNELAKELKW
jgi:radical S-adenosyl methionine domain-containing protein 2